MQYRHPMHFQASYVTAPVSCLRSAPTMHADTHAGARQCMHCTLQNVGFSGAAGAGSGAPDDVVAIVNQVRSDIPAVTHVDWSARIQTVHADTNPRYHRILSEFAALTGCPVIINTSFNVRGEPIVCEPEHAWRCFMATHMDALVLERFVLLKEEQPEAKEGKLDDYLKQFKLD